MKKLCMILPLALIICFMVGCQDKETMAELEAMKAQAEVEKQNKEIVHYALELYDEGNFVERDKLFSPDTVYHAPGGKEYSLKGYREQFGVNFYTAFPDLRHTIEDIIAEGDKVVLRLTDYGTHKGEFMGIPPTGKEIQWPVTSIYRLSNGIVEEVWIELDVLNVMQHLGMELKPKEGEK
jgi:predicted ester cyclase